MAWIETHMPAPEHPALLAALDDARKGYPPEYSPARLAESRMPDAVKQDSIVLSHSLIPAVLRHMFAGYAAMLDPSLPLSRREHEMIAATVSVLNDCYY